MSTAYRPPQKRPAPSSPAPQDKRPRPDYRHVARGFWIASLVWIALIVLIAVACSAVSRWGGMDRLVAPAWAAVGVLVSLGVAIAVDRLCSL
jgi:hypothetical protein